MNPKLVEEVARALLSEISKAVPGPQVEYDDATPVGIAQRELMDKFAQAAIRVCMARAAEIARLWQNLAHAQLHAGEMAAKEKRTVTAIAVAIESAIKREGELT